MCEPEIRKDDAVSRFRRNATHKSSVCSISVPTAEFHINSCKKSGLTTTALSVSTLLHVRRLHLSSVSMSSVHARW